MITVALTGDEPIVLEALRFSIDTEADMAVGGVFASAHELIDAAGNRDVDVVIVDVATDCTDETDETDGLATFFDIRQSRPNLPVVILCSLDGPDRLEPALAGGARGYLLKRATKRDLVESIRVIAAGGSVIAPEMTPRLIATVADSGQRRSSPEGPGFTLTKREMQVLRLVTQGRSNEEIGYELGIVTATAKVHVSNLLKKVKVKNRVGLVIFAFEHRLVRPTLAVAQPG